MFNPYKLVQQRLLRGYPQSHNTWVLIAATMPGGMPRKAAGIWGSYGEEVSSEAETEHGQSLKLVYLIEQRHEFSDSCRATPVRRLCVQVSTPRR